MTSFKSNLALMRTEWYNAFYNANIEKLDYLEAEWFISTNGQKVVYKKHQLRKLSMLAPEFKNNIITRTEHNVEIREFDNIACVTGCAIVEEGAGVTKYDFIENWIKINDGWKLQFMSFDSSKGE